MKKTLRHDFCVVGSGFFFFLYFVIFTGEEFKEEQKN